MKIIDEAMNEIMFIKTAVAAFERDNHCKVDLRITRISGKINSADPLVVPLPGKFPGLAKYMKPGEFFHLNEITPLVKT